MKPIDMILGSQRKTALDAQQCMPRPIGCGGPATEFKDEVSRREYQISRLCQTCQDKIFTEEGA